MSVSSLPHGLPGPAWRWLAAPVLLPALFFLAGCGHGPEAKKKPLVEVTVARPVKGTVQDHEDFTGRLDAYRTVDVRARVTGYLNAALGDEEDKVNKLIKEGDRVAKGDVLFYIDPRSYQADMAQAEANLNLALAERHLQELSTVRARKMFAARSIGKEEFDTILANRDKALATVGSMMAARDRAAIYLAYTEVKAPISGRISRRNVDPGNLVKADDTLLTTIVADDKVYAYFDVDERTYLALAGERPSSSPSARVAGLKTTVFMRLANEEEYKRQGTVDFLDNRLNGNTGTIRLRGVFDNPKGALKVGLLKSGLFVRVRLPVGEPYQADQVPDESLQSDQGNKNVYVVNSEDKVEYRAVRVGQTIKGLRVIKEPRFQLTGDALKALRKEGVPEEVVAKLERLKEQGLEPKNAFLEAVARVLSPNELQQHQAALLEHGFREGLKGDDRVIVSGMQRVRPKDTVKVKE